MSYFSKGDWVVAVTDSEEVAEGTYGCVFWVFSNGLVTIDIGTHTPNYATAPAETLVPAPAPTSYESYVSPGTDNGDWFDDDEFFT